MEDHQNRVLDERASLYRKAVALKMFLRDPEKNGAVDTDEIERMRVQYDIMHSYIAILDDRIAHF